ncbi:monovalent cation:proton antiporter family protein [Pontibacter akesuensis]|uniref:Kef-type potassium/proton antiporter, CPA2 family n=1 Tax=Pontibacter akesuensis TaxID=388950 RepID=A0A1I7G738_9BACT|nr:monovalent cation:proton antiporter family protein [Pontibacter akesuensis]GHA58426.1 potassium transporter KefB [Pontibacter akesuensis]SFU44228.1 Kef-type potassium/proton antiporter, CPA2 family [Pontibacter akesuensis]
MEIPLLSDIVIILGLAVVVILLFQRFKLPTILGFLATGVIAGPHGLSLIKATHDIEILAEIGVILLLFIIGMEFSLKQLALIKRTVLLGGTTQVLATIGLVCVVMVLLRYSWAESVFMGFLIALSSTAIVLKLLQDRSEINSPQGRVVLGILIFQDIVVVPMMLLAPLMAGESEDIGTALLIMALKGIFVIVFVLVSARYLVPRLLFLVAQTKSKELFILCVVVICFAVAWLTSNLGLSLALGAFMAGLIISESEYSHQATSNILPFREIFTSFFFVSIGMLLDFGFMLQNLPVILLFSVLTFILKGTVATLAARILQYPMRISLLVGLSLFQVGEFAFILSKTGLASGLLSEETYQYFLSVSLLTMGVTPFIIGSYRQLADFIAKPISSSNGDSVFSNETTAAHGDLPDLNDHIVIIGYGINGRNVAKAARHADIPYVITELNAVTVKQERKLGEPIVYGDAVHPMILEHINVQKARVVVIAISDPEATRRIIATVRGISDKVHIIVRTRFVQEMEENYLIGADEVIPEEFETSIEIFTRVMNKYLMPRDEIERFTQKIRSDNYDMLRSLASGRIPNNSKISLDLPDIEVASLRVYTNDSDIIGKSLLEANIRNRFQITIVAMKRERETILNVDGHTRILRGDVLYVVGKPNDVMRFNDYLKDSF